MPTYQNTSNARKVVGGTSVEPNETVETRLWNYEGEAGLNKTADTPMYNPIIHSEEVTGDKTINIPAGEKRFLIHFYVESGEVEVLFSSASNTPALKLYTGAKWNVRCLDRLINDIRIKFTAAGSAWVIIERI